MGDYYDRYGQPMAYLHEWGEKHNDLLYKVVARHFVSEDVHVSTVWLGIDHNWAGRPPLIFETMVFGGPHDQEMERYSTQLEALRGHLEIVERLEAERGSKD